MIKRILIIEDDPGILELLHLIFETEGYAVEGFLNGKSAAEIILLKPDMIILDIKIVGSVQTGDQICADLKATTPLYITPVLLLSAEPDLPELSAACFSDSFMAKPFDLDKLLNRVAELTG
ncbi:Transcriptional regulatory protein TcrA [Pedobacter sp. Bi27]|jgi:two-component system, OmpR family, response regulator VicR|uniref:response regulator transcription factor n=1 Tax=Pedobacter sp. Bi27 TaxID=2822351 RepID=UPI001D81708E|nr:response regulator [Pedobacter sp. Bi27]CAH0276724.1 Transcriptional regulatory protein TcrA [Pedobacter sp. Bi27]